MEDANETIASLEDHLEDLKLKAVSKSSSGEDTIDRDESGSAPKATVEEQIKKDEQYRRKRFGGASFAWRRLRQLAPFVMFRSFGGEQRHPTLQRTLRDRQTGHPRLPSVPLTGLGTREMKAIV